MDDDVAPLVFDGGSYTCKAGFAGDDSPRVIIPTIVGRQLDHNQHDTQSKHIYVGFEAQERRELLSITSPVEHGSITHWEDMETVWSHLFYDNLHVAPEQHRTLLIDAPLNSKANREKMAEVMFERFNSPAFYVADQAALCFYEDSDRDSTGIVVDIGDSVTHITPVYQGFSIPHATSRLMYGGRNITDYLVKSLGEDRHQLGRGSARDIASRVKEMHCHVALDYEQELLESAQHDNLGISYKLPDGNRITVRHEAFSGPEVLFQPAFVGLQLPAIDKAIFNTLQRCDVEMRSELCEQIVLSGGTTMLPGLADRLTKELAIVLPSSNMRIIVCPERKYSAWIGGSILASLSTFDKMWVFRQAYEEFGPSIVNRSKSPNVLA